MEDNLKEILKTYNIPEDVWEELLTKLGTQLCIFLDGFAMENIINPVCPPGEPKGIFNNNSG